MSNVLVLGEAKTILNSYNMAETIKSLSQKVSVLKWGTGSYKLSIQYKNKWYSTISHNSLAYDRYCMWLHGIETSPREIACNYTALGALKAFYDEGNYKRKHNLMFSK